MTACCGSSHTITLSNDGTLYSFGHNVLGQLGLGHNDNVSLPTPIPNLPKISIISCGVYFTVCVDHEGFVWSFGENNEGQLGTGNTTNFNVPQKLLDLPPVIFVSCGDSHTLMITNDSNLWACGGNSSGQLCLGHENKEGLPKPQSFAGANLWFSGSNALEQLYRGKKELKPQKTSFSNISKISAGSSHSLFQNNKGEIFSCGNNHYGACGLGNFDSPQITPSLIHNAPSNIVHFVCGYQQSLFLDSEGNVFSVGFNVHGQLGLGHNTNQNELNKIPNIPPIKTISCVGSSCYLIDLEENIWTFGLNQFGQLGHGDKANKNIPTIINTLKEIQQISYGCGGNHFLVKNSQKQIFVTGRNDCGQLGTGDTQAKSRMPTGGIKSISIPREINSQYSTIWREVPNRAKSARK